MEMSKNSSLYLQRFYPPELEIIFIDESKDEIWMHTISRSKVFCCPGYGKQLHKLHSTHHRKVQDLLIMGKRFFLDIQVHDFQCPDRECKTGSFSETFHGFFNYYNRMTRASGEFLNDPDSGN